MSCPCRTAKRLVMSVINLVEFWILDIENDEKEDELKKELIEASNIFRKNKQLYENNKHKEKGK